MKAIVQDEYGPVEVLHLADIEKPVPGPSDVLVRVYAAGVDAGVWHVTTGMPYMVRLMGLGLRAPKGRVRGTEFAGVVEAVGEAVGKNVAGVQPGAMDVRPGDEVFGACPPLGDQGSFADYTLGSPARLARKPTNLTFEEAAVVPVSGCTALQGLRAGAVEPGKTVLVIGASGGVGTFAVQLAKAFGAEVTGVCSAAKADLVGSIGADQVLDYERVDIADGSRRYDLILDNGGRRPLSHLRRALTPRGTLVIVGGDGGNRWTGGFERQMLTAPLVSLAVSQSLRPLNAKVQASDLDILRGLIEAGKVTPMVDRAYPLAQAPEAVRDLHDGRVRGKLVLSIERS